MKKLYDLKRILEIFKTLVLIFVFVFLTWLAMYPGQLYGSQPYPFSTDSTNITIWNGTDYEPFFVKGMNFGVSVPGKFPGELFLPRKTYTEWFQLIKDAGFNTIRLYTLHFPAFYEVLDSFNLANPHNPLFFFQGVWLEEEALGFSGNLMELSSHFQNEIEENVDCVHGNRIILPRLGKAWGDYTANVSRWNIGYIIGREVHPGEVMQTNEDNINFTSWNGLHLAIENAQPVEAFIVSKLDHLVGYEYNNYDTQRPVSFSSWPTQDPLEHPEEWNEWEDTTHIDLSRIDLINAAGYFASYHAYPYYPDFINYDEEYQDFNDNYGPNSYLGYLTALKEHYARFPLIIAEFGVPSSWGIAHYSTSGMHHGGFSEREQGEVNIRILKSIETAGCGGGIQFALIDEWFKRTWVTDHIDYLMNRRVLWHNVTAAEQNFGLISFRKPREFLLWDYFGFSQPVTSVEAAANFDFFNLKINLSQQFAPLDEMWISLDTYASTLGESIMPTGDTLTNRAEFALHITNHSANLYVTQAYDLYGYFHGISEPEQLYHSIPTDGAPWNIVRWKVNEFDQDIQYIGNMKVNFGFLPPSSLDAVTIFEDHIIVQIPWTLIHFVDPSEKVVFHDYRETWQPEDTISDGISATIIYNDKKYTPQNRFLWENWNHALDAKPQLKQSYWVAHDRLHEFNNRAISMPDEYSFIIDGEPAIVSQPDGVLKNDFDLDGNFLLPLLLTPPENGRVTLENDGSFTYEPFLNFVGTDYFEYTLFDGYSLSEPALVSLQVEVITSDQQWLAKEEMRWEPNVFPVPATSGQLWVSSSLKVDSYYLFDENGRLMLTGDPNLSLFSIETGNLRNGVFMIVLNSGDKKYVRKIIVSEI